MPTPHNPKTSRGGAEFLLSHPDTAFRAFMETLDPLYFQSICAEWYQHPTGALPIDALVCTPKMQRGPGGVLQPVPFIPTPQSEKDILVLVCNKLIASWNKHCLSLDDWLPKMIAASMPFPTIAEILSQYPQIKPITDLTPQAVNNLDLEELRSLQNSLAEQMASYRKKSAEVITAIANNIYFLEGNTTGRATRFDSVRQLMQNKPEMPIFADNRMPWVLPSGIVRTKSGFEVNYGATTYFQYVGTREGFKPLEDRNRAIQFAAGGIIFRKIAGKSYLLYTLRSERNEAFPRTYNHVGGAGQYPGEGRQLSPYGHFMREVYEECGVSRDSVIVGKTPLLGIVRETYFNYIQPIYKVTIAEGAQFTRKNHLLSGGESETVYHFAGNTATKRAGEIILKQIPWEARAVRNLLTCTPSRQDYGDEFPRLMVPAAAMVILQAGRVDFGEKWYQETFAAYEAMLKELGKRLGKL